MKHPRIRCRLCQSAYVLAPGDRPGSLVWQCPLWKFETLYFGVPLPHEQLAANEAEQFSRHLLAQKRKAH